MTDIRIQSGLMVALGYGKYIRSDEIAALEPIGEGRGPGRRTRVWIRGQDEPLVASRSSEALFFDLTRPRDDATKTRLQRSVLERVARTLDEVPGTYRRRLRESDGIDLDDLAGEARRAIA